MNKTEKTIETLSGKSNVSLNAFATEVHENAVAHGWWEQDRGFGEIIALCHSELSEALEEYRNGKPMAYFVDEINDCENTDLYDWHGEKLEGIATEMADCIIRILDWCVKEGVDIEKIIRLKHEYNKTRPYKHGGKVI